MRHMENVLLVGQATFGRNGAMFESLLSFVAQLSMALWVLVLVTIIIRFVGVRIYRRDVVRAALADTAASSAPAPATSQLTQAARNRSLDRRATSRSDRRPALAGSHTKA